MVAVRQGAGVEELLEAFDTVMMEYGRMDAGQFNDTTYKIGLKVPALVGIRRHG
jgi:hypothetical protein